MFTIFGEKIGVFLKKQCYDQIFALFSFVLSQKRDFFSADFFRRFFSPIFFADFFRRFFSAKIFLKNHNIGPRLHRTDPNCVSGGRRESLFV
jgi:hypothetical protein